MKTILRRTAVLLLVLAMVLSMLPSVFAAAGSKIYNEGIRDQACTALSAQANAYYTGSYTYEKLSALSGASETASSYDATQNNPLYDALYELMSTTQTDYYSYNSLSTDFAYTDSVAGASEGEMSDIWGGRLDTWNGSYFNREHVWPKSRASFYQINGGADRHHLRPASAYINTKVHINYPYGNTTNGTAYYDELGNPGGWMDGTYYEPNDNVKGDVARILLYVYVRWQQPNLYSDVVSDNLPALDEDDNSNNGLKVIQSLDVLLQWCEDDPVDTWEMGRNDAAEKIQGNRNVFIDYPELAWLMFSQEIPKMTTPSGIANQQQENITKTYTVTWNVDGKTTTEVYEKDAMPSFKGSTAKADDADYSYTFTGWSPALAPVTADVTYTAQYSRTLHQYTVTWSVDGKMTTEVYDKYATPVFKGSTGKADDADYSYTFTGWSPSIAPVTADVTYTAQYSRTLHQYTVTWVVDGKTTTEVYEKYATPVFKGSTDKPSDGTYLYTFAGWSPALAPVTADVTYTALYNQILVTAETYTVTWVVDGKTTTEIYEKGAMPSYKGSTDKPSDGTYSYTFTGWSPALAPVTADVTYTAQYSRELLPVETYTVTWNVDGKLTAEVYEEGAIPSFKGSTDKPSDGTYSYTFTGWYPEIAPVTADVTYTAQYSRELLPVETYTVTWVVDGKTTTEVYEKGAMPSYKGSTYKPSDGTYSYTFTGWSPALAPVTADVTYTAQYSRTAIQGGSDGETTYYTVTWYLDGRAVCETYAKGEIPVFKGSTDKDDDDRYSYVFAGWTPRILPVTADAFYTALYTKVLREADVYTVTWVVDGRQTTEEYAEGETPVFKGSTDKADDAQYCYLFSGWSPALAEVTADVTYTAQYTRYALTKSSDFADVTEDDWFYAEVNRAAQLGLFNGVGEAHFNPEGQVSRAMLVTVLYRLAGEPEVDFKTIFLDVKKGQWYSDAVIWAYEEGITMGTDAAHFSPDAAVTREQTATFLCRYAQWEGYDVSARADLSGFPDEDAVSAYAEDALSWAVANGLISGSAQNGSDYLLPGGTAIRAQAAAIMVRFFNAFVK